MPHTKQYPGPGCGWCLTRMCRSLPCPCPVSFFPSPFQPVKPVCVHHKVPHAYVLSRTHQTTAARRQAVCAPIVTDRQVFTKKVFIPFSCATGPSSPRHVWIDFRCARCGSFWERVALANLPWSPFSAIGGEKHEHNVPGERDREFCPVLLHGLKMTKIIQLTHTRAHGFIFIDSFSIHFLHVYVPAFGPLHKHTLFGSDDLDLAYGSRAHSCAIRPVRHLLPV